MRKTLLTWCVLFVVGAGSFTTAQRGPERSSEPEQFVGTWSGTWDGSGSGGFELTMEKGKDGPVTGTPVNVLGASHFELRDGKVLREWRVIDEIAILAQIHAGRVFNQARGESLATSA